MPGSAHCPMRLAACATRDRGVAQSHAPPHAHTGGTANMPRRCSSSSTGSPSHEFVGSGRGHARPFPKWGTRSLCQHPLSLLERGLQWFTGPPGIGYRDCATRRETYVCLTPLPWALTLFPVTHPASVPPVATLLHTVKLGPNLHQCSTILVDA